MNPENAAFLGSYIIAAGTTQLDTQAGLLQRVTLGGTFVGSFEFYDTGTVSGTAAGNQMYNIGLPLLNQYKSIDLQFPYKRGLVVVATGTPTGAVTWRK